MTRAGRSVKKGWDRRPREERLKVSRRWANQSNKDWDGYKFTTRRATRGVEQNKVGKIETEINLPRTERFEVLSKTKHEKSRQSSQVKSTTNRATRGVPQTQSNTDWDGDMSKTNRATGSVEQNKARFKIDTETINQNEKCHVWAP